MKSDDPRYPFLKRVCERPTWRALHAWIQAAGVKRSGFDVALPPLKLAVRVPGPLRGRRARRRRVGGASIKRGRAHEDG